MTSIKRFKYRDEANDLIEVMDPSNIAGNLRISWTDAPDLTWHSQILRLVLPRHSQQHRFGQWYGNDYIQLTTVYHHLCSNNIKSTHHHHAACPVDIARASSMPVDFVIKKSGWSVVPVYWQRGYNGPDGSTVVYGWISMWDVAKELETSGTYDVCVWAVAGRYVCELYSFEMWSVQEICSMRCKHHCSLQSTSIRKIVLALWFTNSVSVLITEVTIGQAWSVL